MQERVGVVLRGSSADEPLIAAGCRLLHGREGDLVVLLLRPRTLDGLVWSAGLDPERLRREAEAGQRRAVRELLRRQGGGIRCSITPIGRRSLRAAVEIGAEEGWTSLVLPAFRLRGRRLRRRLAGTGLRTIFVPIPGSSRASMWSAPR
jgi:hypothetical protein